MWDRILPKIAMLRSLDTQCVSGGTYVFQPPITEKEIKAAERRLGVSLPPELVYIYTTIGNGGAGPGSLLSADTLEAHHPSEAWPGIALYNDVNADLSGGAMRGLVVIMYRYYNYQSCVACNGPERGSVIAYEEDMFACLEATDIAGIYTKWLDKDIAHFDFLQGLVLQSDDIEAIALKLHEEMDWHPQPLLESVASLLGFRVTQFEALSLFVWHDHAKTFKITPSARQRFAQKIRQYQAEHHDTTGAPT